jgi:histidyl-tRNA synthetase
MEFQPVKGTRDFLPEEMRTRQKVLKTVRGVFEKFGFQPLETPAIENWEVLSAKSTGGPEVLKETFNFEDFGGRRIGLRYDLTVPLARVVASNPSLALPFKRYQIQKVWRYGDVAKGRLREFLQADIDTVGSENMLADAEIVACAIAVFTALGFEKFILRISNRKLLSALVTYAGVEESKVIDVFRAIDKVDKVGENAVKDELVKRGITDNAVKKILAFIKISGEPEKVLSETKRLVKSIEEGEEGIEELRQLVDYLRKMKVEPKFRIDLSLARGLDYYTGPVFEVFAEEGIGSVAGGGRYDKMIGLFSGKDIPATGISLGIERIMEVVRERKMVTSENKVKVFVAGVNESVALSCLDIVQTLRRNGIPTDFDLKNRKLTRQLEYADAMKIPYVVIIGPKELAENLVKVRDMKKKTEKEVKINELVKVLK